jgi:Leucine-rich repeat (LRR) protein
MFKLIINFLFFNITIAQIHLTKDNLDQVCGCKASQTAFIILWNKNITTIDPSTFNGLNSLHTLWLQNNQLTTADQSTFNGLNSLKELNLNNNQLTKVEPSTFNGLNSLQGFNKRIN